MEASSDRFAVAVVRAWIEPSDPVQLKVRIVRPTDGRAPECTIGVASGVDDAIATLRTWLERFAAGEAPACADVP